MNPAYGSGYETAIEDAVRRIIEACGCGTENGCNKNWVHNHDSGTSTVHPGCARFVRAVRGE